jgi:lysophospholipase L1-like esterase
MPVTSTWWYRILDGMGWDLCVNNSYSGGRVSHPYSYETRAVNLHTDDGVKPDVIIIYYGINDYNNMVGLSSFSSSYATMLKNMRAAYPDATIYCCTLNPIICTDNGRNTSLEKNGDGVALTSFNSEIVRLADANGAGVIDFYSAIGETLYQYTYDNIHPTAQGMQMMADVVMQVLKNDYAQ